MDTLLNTDAWSKFTGYGILPGIKHARFEQKTSAIVGSRIKVENTDGSRHVEEILLWEEGKRVEMKMHEFSAPLKFMASHF